MELINERDRGENQGNPVTRVIKELPIISCTKKCVQKSTKFSSFAVWVTPSAVSQRGLNLSSLKWLHRSPKP